MHGPDDILLQQIALRWEDLRAEFGDSLLRRFSGLRANKPESKIWESLALVAHQNSTLQQELEREVSNDPELLKRKGVLGLVRYPEEQGHRHRRRCSSCSPSIRGCRPCPSLTHRP